MKQIFGGFENVGATVVDCKNFRREINLFVGDHDAYMLIEKLNCKQVFCPCMRISRLIIHEKLK